MVGGAGAHTAAGRSWAPQSCQPQRAPQDVVGNLLVQVRVRLVNHHVQQVKAAGRD